MFQFIYKFDKILPYLVVLATSVLFVLISFQANELQYQISKQTNGIIMFIYSTNNIIAFLLPIMFYVFVVLTTRMMLYIFDYESIVIKTDLNKFVAYSFTPVFLTISFYAINIVRFSDIVIVNSMDDIKRIRFYFNLTFQDFERINTVGWIGFYTVLVLVLTNKLKINIIKSAIIVITPSLIVLLSKFIMSNIS